MNLSNKTALVTGANRGIGLALAHDLAKLGARVIMGSRVLADGKQAAAEVTASAQAIPGRVEAIQLDVADPASISIMAEELERRGVEVDILINNAGVYSDGDALNASVTAFRHDLEVNLFGAIQLCQLLVPGMVKRGWGRVVNVSSDYASLSEGLEGPAAYCVSKVALTAYTVKLAQVAGPSVKINAVSPGWVRTRMGGQEAWLSPEEGAARVMWGVLLPDDGPTGRYAHEFEVRDW